MMNRKPGLGLSREFDGLDVVDARQSLRIIVKQEDVDNAHRKDPGMCVFAKACGRMFGASKVFIWRWVAYVEMPGKDGVRRLERFRVTPEARKLIGDFDKGVPIKPGASFTLDAPKKAFSMEHKRKIRRESRERCRINGVSWENTRNTHPIDRPIETLLVRSGQGSVHFARQTKAKR